MNRQQVKNLSKNIVSFVFGALGGTLVFLVAKVVFGI